MENLGYLLAAFALIWAVLFAYLFILSGRERRLRRELDSLAHPSANTTPRG